MESYALWDVGCYERGEVEQDVLACGLPVEGIDPLEAAREHFYDLLGFGGVAQEQRVVVGLNDGALYDCLYNPKVYAHTLLGATVLEFACLTLHGHFEAVGVSVQAAAPTLVAHKCVSHL